jgi:2,5-diketo-D-gluconate reductase A
MPMVGYGVYQVAPAECERCVLDALKAGYRSIDTAQAYNNEKEVGNAIKKSGVPRDDIFLTTKVWITNYGYEQTKASVEESLRKLQTDYLDLCLLHQPFSDYYGAWRALAELNEEGKIRAIGVSNFYPDRLIDLSIFSGTVPMVNQVETHPLFQQKQAHEIMQKYKIQHESWAPFGEGRGGLFTNDILKGIGDQYGKTPAQVMLRWQLQRGIVVIPKSVHYERMQQNLDILDFKLSDADMEKIAAMDTGKSSFFSHYDPDTVEWFGSVVESRKAH